MQSGEIEDTEIGIVSLGCHFFLHGLHCAIAESRPLSAEYMYIHMPYWLCLPNKSNHLLHLVTRELNGKAHLLA